MEFLALHYYNGCKNMHAFFKLMMMAFQPYTFLAKIDVRLELIRALFMIVSE